MDREWEGTEADAMEDWADYDEEDFHESDGSFQVNQSQMRLKRDVLSLLTPGARRRGEMEVITAATSKGKSLVQYKDGSIREETVVAEFGGKVITSERQKSLLVLYAEAKSAKVGTVIVCPSCGTRHKKTTYHKVFCSNGKKSRKDCKSKYHNTIHPERLARVF